MNSRFVGRRGNTRFIAPRAYPTAIPLRRLRSTRHTVVSVTGDAVGDFAGHNVTQPSWKLWRSGDSWYLVKASGTTVIFR